VTRRFAKAVLGAGAASLLALASACASAPEVPEPEWFAAEAGERDSEFPSLQDVPQTHTANTNQAYWTGVANELEAAEAAMRAHPRAQAAPPEDPDAFLDEARRDIEATRDAH
jgi:hypothetical protein